MFEEIKFICPNCSAEVNTSDMIKNQLEENKIMGMPLPLIISEGFNKLKVSKAIRYANEKYNEAVVYANSKQLPATTNIHRAIAILKIVMELQEMQCNNTATINEQLKKLETEKEKLQQTIIDLDKNLQQKTLNEIELTEKISEQKDLLEIVKKENLELQNKIKSEAEKEQKTDEILKIVNDLKIKFLGE